MKYYSTDPAFQEELFYIAWSFPSQHAQSFMEIIFSTQQNKHARVFPDRARVFIACLLRVCCVFVACLSVSVK